jgi:hypothetical protein
MTENKSTSTTVTNLDKFVQVIEKEFLTAANQRKIDIANNQFNANEEDPLEFNYILDLDQGNPTEMHILNKHQVPIVTLMITRLEEKEETLTASKADEEQQKSPQPHYRYYVKIALRRMIPKLPPMIYNVSLSNTTSIMEEAKQLHDALQRAIDQIQIAHYCEICGALTFSEELHCNVCLFSACLNSVIQNCSICQEDTHRYFTLPQCNHSFHYKCLKQVEFQKESTPYGTILNRHCPLCRKTFSLSA